MSFSEDLRSIVQSCYKNGKVIDPKDKPVVMGYGIMREDARTAARLLTELVMLTDYTKPDTKAFLFNSNASYRKIGSIDGTAANKNTARSRIQYDLLKLRSVLGEDALDVIIRNRNADLTGYINKISGLLDKCKGRPLADGVILKIKAADRAVNDISVDDYNLLHTIFFQYAKKQKAKVESLINTDMSGYLRYLHENRDCLSGVHMDRYKELEALVEAER